MRFRQAINLAPHASVDLLASGASRPSIWPPVITWAATRLLLMLSIYRIWKFPGTDVTPDVWWIYHHWYQVLLGGSFPTGDVTWQYPPVAAGAILAPGLLPFLGYATAFYLLAIAADGVVLALLLRASRAPGGRMAGVWLWVVGMAVLGPVIMCRYDVMVTALAVGALLAAVRHPRIAGALTAVGALFKVWPVLVLAGTARGRATWRSWTAAVLTGAGLCLAFLLLTRGAFGFLTEQGHRGIEIESVAALPFHIARLLGLWHGTDQLHYGSFEFLGPYVHAMSVISLGVTGLAFAWLAWWRIRARVFDDAVLFDAAFAAVLLFITTSRVISPQYMIWLLGLGGLCLVRRRTVQGLPIALVLLACFFTVLEFPVAFGHVIESDGPGVVLILARNGLLVAAALIACRRLWRATVPGRAAVGAGSVHTRPEEPAFTS